jgi:pimeloyl-ACP methyl ester carboxylesterase
VPSTPDPVLLLHGQPGGAREWDRVVAAIGGRAKTIAVDRPGWDLFGVPRDLPGNVAAAIGVLDLDQVPRSTVVGHSFGAAVAAWLAADHPERVGGLVLTAPAANVASLTRLDRWLVAPVAGKLLSVATVTGPGLALASSHVRRRLAARLDLDEDYLRDEGRALRSPAAWRAFVTEQRALVSGLPLLESRLGRIAAPTSIVIGSADRVVPNASARRLAAQIPGARVIVVQGAGHLLSMRHPVLVAEVVLGAGTRAAAGARAG